jgi:RNA polymerase sigma-70 factor, ECF subfamily
MNCRNAALDGARALSGASVSADERALVAQAKSGSSSAFGELYERHRLNLFRSAFRILRNREDAEDAVQRSFQRAFTSIAQFREDSTFSTWMTRIVINEVLMLLRQQRIAFSLWQSQNDDVNETRELDVPDERPTPEQTLAKEELRSLVLQAISRLRGSLQSVVLLRELQGLTSAEAARCLGLTVSAVKARTFHARRHLRRHLNHNWPYSRCARPVRPNIALGSQDPNQSTISGCGHG